MIPDVVADTGTRASPLEEFGTNVNSDHHHLPTTLVFRTRLGILGLPSIVLCHIPAESQAHATES